MQGGVYKRRLPKCFHAAPSCFRTPPTPHHAIGYHFSLRQQFRHHQYSPKRPYRKMHHVCGTSANIAQKRILLAELPQILHKNVSYLRNFRKDYTKLHPICGRTANIKQKRFLFAEVPQILHKNASTCGTSANGMQIKNTPYYIIAPFAR